MTAPRLILAVLLTLAAAVVTATAVAVADAGSPTPRVAAVDESPSAAASRTEALAVLADWDRRRAAAWAAGDRSALAELYAPGSRAGRRDAAMLARWVERGLRVTDLRMQVLDVQVRAAGSARWELDVTDRLAGGQAVGRRTTVPLPRDGWSTRRVVLEQVAGQWRVVSVSRRARP